MQVLVVVDDPDDWPVAIPEVKVISAKKYLSGEDLPQSSTRVFNLCTSYQYQTTGYYVSLLAAARKHKPVPQVLNIVDMNTQGVVRFFSKELEHLIQQSLRHIKSERFTLNVYFARSLHKTYSRLSLQLYSAFQAPLLKATFIRNSKWYLSSIRPLEASDIPEHDRAFVLEAARDYFSSRKPSQQKQQSYRYDLAILYDQDAPDNPSTPKAMQKFIKAARVEGLEPTIITKSDIGRLAEFDALFIRQTTNVNHFTYKFANRAEKEGLVVIDDPRSILQCTNKVYLAELLKKHKVPTPKTVLLYRADAKMILREIGFPCVLKLPDSSFSQGVVKVNDEHEFKLKVKEMLKSSDIIIAQEFIPTSFDWRVGVLDKKPFYVCKYYMAHKHWQIVKKSSSGRSLYGNYETFAVEDVPPKVLSVALKAANLIGDGLYGVDIKQVDNSFYVIEVNDNPSIDAGLEDKVLKDELYLMVMRSFVARIEKKKLVSK